MKKHPFAGKTIEKKVFFYTYASWAGKDYMSGEFCASDSFPSKNSTDAILLASKHVSLTVPEDFDPVPKQVAALQAKKAEITAQFSLAVAELNRQLSELQAIEYEAPAESQEVEL